MGKVYVVVDEWVRDYGECDTNILGVFTDRKDAVETLTKQVAYLRKTSDYDHEDYEENDYYDAYNAGYYNEAHDHTFIQEVELDQKPKIG